ncbi:MAG: D-alanyl-D-alanine carboxypeptidase family protein [Pseudoxanthomonas suwonensis]|nr:D-alanyl-D-alanine carboxypeptidase family protein [Pseudoxanthomonas suwonensis]
MPPRPALLLNAAAVESWPAWLLRARANADARLLAHSRWVVRRKDDGRYLAAVGADGRVTPMDRPAWRGPLRQAALALVQRRPCHRGRTDHPSRPLPLHGLHSRLAMLGLDATAYQRDTGLRMVAEPDWLAFAGFDRYRRPLWLRADAARAWSRMREAAGRDGVMLEAISGYRSHAYQLGIFQRKRARGLAVEDILAVNAAPGFSEHHSGLALDLGTPGEPPAEESFERTAAFSWLQAHAGEHGFVMSYPRHNPHGIVHEPWHWAWQAAPLASMSS